MSNKIKVIVPDDLGLGLEYKSDDQRWRVKVDESGPITLSAAGLNVNNPKLAKAVKDGGYKPVATVQLQSAFGTDIGYAFLEDERVGS